MIILQILHKKLVLVKSYLCLDLCYYVGCCFNVVALVQHLAIVLISIVVEQYIELIRHNMLIVLVLLCALREYAAGLFLSNCSVRIISQQLIDFYDVLHQSLFLLSGEHFMADIV